MILSRKPLLRERAGAARREPTEPERRLWQAVQNGELGGLRFRRQAPVGPYVADLVCLAAMLVVEVEGDSHADPRADAARDAWLTVHGVRVLRFAAADVMHDLPGVLQAILSHATSPAPCVRPPRASSPPP